MSYEAMDNKTFAYSILRKLLDVGELDSTTRGMLCNPDECKHLFCFSGKTAVLKEVSLMCTKKELDKVCYDRTKRQRYYKDVITVSGKSYVVCNHWYSSNKSMLDNRTPFLQWADLKFESVNSAIALFLMEIDICIEWYLIRRKYSKIRL